MENYSQQVPVKQSYANINMLIEKTGTDEPYFSAWENSRQFLIWFGKIVVKWKWKHEMVIAWMWMNVENAGESVIWFSKMKNQSGWLNSNWNVFAVS